MGLGKGVDVLIFDVEAIVVYSMYYIDQIV